ncbi:diphosphomevalonate decarboxylase [Flavobacterium sp. CBA20B-1]|uniref:diphosphomevalonate/mevalonate 3,5-bisphosphate decarboxylase family protein n=1 Tax=unclassified Flavobacterium TaxID=196869 RepID=UPI0022242052|nr:MULTISPECIES: diphosphomevalonate decarboxylase [unclassified Flavobacterium]WCM41782.1 diphosphomevalonate decarboxylase [Flavobacterium sp. CBA20B-1]
MTTLDTFKTTNYTKPTTKGSFTFSAPSNIALVKYWGKKEHQIPANPSLSFTLNNCKTVTTLQYEPKTEKNISFDLLFEGQPKESFRPKIQKYFERIQDLCPYILDYHFTIDTKNTFPHSSGIASSASGMAALSANIIALEKLIHPNQTEAYYLQKASLLARLGSGSACRSIKGNIVVWGKTESIENSSDLFGVDFPYEINAVFQHYQDTILLVDKGEKQVSSTVGHELMHNHPFAARRFQQAHEHIAKLKDILKSGNLTEFIALVESEALTLHAMMMTSMPYFILMKPNTLEIINQLWKFRETTYVPVCFTLDAGANVHVLYPNDYKEEVQKFIANELAKYCQNNQFIHDEMGFGAIEL